jgi:phage terminase large subunit
VEQVAAGKCWNCGVEQAVAVVVTPRGKERGLCRGCYENSVILKKKDDKGTPIDFAWYTPQPHQVPYHESNTPNLLALGTRDTGKSTMMRKDAIIRCMSYPGFKALIIRRKMPDLRKSHLRFIGQEMHQLGREIGYYRESTFDVMFSNGSFIQFSHCEKMSDVENYLSSEWDLIVFDEVSTFPLQMFLTISAAARSADDAPWLALVRCGSNPLGMGAAWMKAWFIDHEVDLSEYQDYEPDDFEMQFSTLDQNRYSNKEAYEKRLRVLPAHIQRAWLKGEFVIEGAYFEDFRQLDGEERPWHVIDVLPQWPNRQGVYTPMMELGWVSVYRAVDWGFNPDPAVCLWIAVLPNGHEIVFKEKHWKKTLAKDVAKEIVKESKGMRVLETFCDASMFGKDGNSDYSIAEIFENNGVGLTGVRNDRKLAGYSICEHLGSMLAGAGEMKDGTVRAHPKMQILFPDFGAGCKELLRTIPIMTRDPLDPEKIAEGDDHWVIALAYFCMGRATPAKDPIRSDKPYWMRKPGRKKRIPNRV